MEGIGTGASLAEKQRSGLWDTGRFLDLWRARAVPDSVKSMDYLRPNLGLQAMLADTGEKQLVQCTSSRDPVVLPLADLLLQHLCPSLGETITTSDRQMTRVVPIPH